MIHIEFKYCKQSFQIRSHPVPHHLFAKFSYFENGKFWVGGSNRHKFTVERGVWESEPRSVELFYTPKVVEISTDSLGYGQSEIERTRAFDKVRASKNPCRVLQD